MQIEKLNDTQLNKRLKIGYTVLYNKMKQTAKMDKYSRNFGLWLTERWGEPLTTIKWSEYGGAYDNHIWDGTKDPFEVMMQALADRKWVAAESGTGTGKSFLTARGIFWFLDTMGGTVISTSPTKEQLENVLWSEIAGCFHKFQKLRPQAEMYKLRIFPDGKLRDKSMLLDDEFLKKNKISKAVGLTAKVSKGAESTVALQGYHDDPMLIVIDECAGIHPAVMTAIKNTSSDPENNLILALGNPDNMMDQLHQFAELENVVHVRVSALDHPNAVLNRKVIPGAVTQSSIDIRLSEYGEKSPLYESRVRGVSPKQAVGSLFNYEWLEKLYDATYQPDDVDNSYNAAGVDAANSVAGDKASAIFGKANIVTFMKEFQCPDASHLGYNLIMDPLELAEHKYHDYGIPTIYDYEMYPQNVGVDGVGIGISTVQALHNKQTPVISLIAGEKQMEAVIPLDQEEKPLYKYANQRSQWYWQLRLDFEHGRIGFAINDRLILKKLFRELMAHKYSTKNGKTTVLSKDDVKELLNGESPNLADSLAYWNWMRHGYYMGGMFVPL
jgi:hypothetical protein